MNVNWLRTIVIVCGAAIWLPAAVALSTTSVHADDDGGGGGGDGGASGGGGGEGGASDGPGGGSWSTPGRRTTATRCRGASWFGLCLSGSSRRVGRPARTRNVAAPRRQQAPQLAREIIVVGATDAQLATLSRRGFTVQNQAASTLLGAPIARVRIPSRLSMRRAITRASRAAPTALVAENALYRRSRLTQYRPAGTGCGATCDAFQLTAWQQSSDRCATGISVGVVDTAVDITHPSLRGVPITVRTVRSGDRSVSESDHGTGVVSLLAGQGGADVVGLLRGSRILAADAFHGGADGSSADTFDLVAALDWLATEDVRVINMSLTGPDNAVLKRAVEQVQGRGTTLVVAAGRPDSENRLGYPARYADVVAVSAVDNRLRPSRLSARGAHITFAAPGVGITVAAGNGLVRRVDGTSFAAPFVTAAYVRGLANRRTPADIEGALAKGAKDLGAPGRDPVYGHGLLQFSALPPC